MRGDYRQNSVWNFIMLFSDAVFNIFAGVFDVLNDVRQNVAVVLLFCIRLSPPRCYYSCPCAVMRNLDAIIRIRMLLCETSMLLFVSVCCFAKPRCYYSCSNCTSDKLIMPVLPVQRKFMLFSIWRRKLSSNI